MEEYKGIPFLVFDIREAHFIAGKLYLDHRQAVTWTWYLSFEQSVGDVHQPGKDWRGRFLRAPQSSPTHHQPG